MKMTARKSLMNDFPTAVMMQATVPVVINTLITRKPVA
jgi:hypothetical protein